MIYVDIVKKLANYTLDVKFECDNGVLSILGASGSGKSMTLKCIAGIETPDEGVIKIDEEVVFDSKSHINVPARKRKVGYLFQDYALFPHMMVEDNIRCVYDAECGYTVEELFDMFHISRLKNAYPSKLSGGEKQRVALARMIGNAPRIMMLDEPFSALDSFLKWELEGELIKHFEEFGKNVIYVSHNRDEVYRLSDRIAIMDSGKIAELDTKKNVFERPKTLSGLILTGCKNLSKVSRLSDNTLYANDWGIKLSFENNIPENVNYAGFRAHFFEVVDIEEENTIKARITRVIEDTFSVIITFENANSKGEGEWTSMRYEVSKEEYEKIKDVKELYLRIDTDKVILV